MNEESTEILIPKKRFDEVNEKLKALREENKALTKEANQRLQKCDVGLCRGENHAGFKRDFCRSRIPEKRIRGNRLQDLHVPAGKKKNRFGEGNRKNQTTGNLGGKNNGN